MIVKIHLVLVYLVFQLNCFVVCGTAFIMAEARAELGIVEPKDGDILYNISGEWIRR